MRRLLGKALIFVGITTLCILGINSFVRQAGRTYADGATVICLEKRAAVRTGQIRAQAGRDNVLFLGHSAVLAGIVPQQFDDAAGGRICSWNLSLPALPIGPHYFLLKEYLRHNPPPRFVVVKLSLNYSDQFGYFDSYATKGSAVDEICSYAFSQPSKTVVWNYLLPIRLDRGQSLRYLRSRLSDPGGIDRTRSQNQAIAEGMYAQRGYYYIREQARFAGQLPDDYREPSDGTREHEVQLDHDPYVQRFFDLAQQQGIRVLLIETPLRPGQTPQRTAMPPWYSQLLSRYSNVRMAKQGWKLKFYENRLFSDPTHLNPQGAERFTREIYAEFIQAFPPDELMVSIVEQGASTPGRRAGDR